MAVLPFRRHGHTRAQKIHARIAAATQGWWRAWSVQAGACDVEPRADGEAPSQCAWMSTPDGRLTIALPNNGLARLGAVLAGVHLDDGRSFAEAIGRRALADLVASCTERAEAEALVEVEPDAAALRSRHGALCFRVATATLSLDVHLSARACDALVAPASAAPIALVQRRQALLGSSVHLTATLDLGLAAIDAAMTLRPGEIIKVSAITDARVVVQGSQGAPLFQGVLDSIDGRKALRCTHVHLQ